MRFLLTPLLILLWSFQSFALDKLPETYRVKFGNPAAKYKVTEYFSFMCPHCIALFRKEFQKIKESMIDTDEVFFEFHPVPQDLPTVQAMICFEKLTNEEKQIFIDVILDSVDVEDSTTTPLLMQRAMEVLKKPVSELEDVKFIEKTKAFQDAFEFIKQEDRIEAIPAIEVNGKLYPNDVPEKDLIFEKIEEIKGIKT
jgi:thiol-disulfide isomerase/thioredoxin